jgi:hypothetical protein
MIKKNKKSRTVTLYIKPEYDETYKQMAVILQREGRSLSDWVWERIRKYVEAHKAGNEQQTLPHVIETGLPYRAPNECVLCGSLAVFRVRYNGKDHKACASCLKDLKRRGEVGYRRIEK